MKIFAVDLLDNPSFRTPLTAGKIIASGGAGDIRICEQDTGLVIKLYKNDTDKPLYQRKLAAMLETPPLLPDLDVDGASLPQLSWPKDLVVDDRGQFLGYRMPKLSLNKAVSLERFLQRRMRQHEGLPEFYIHRIRVAHNLAALIEKLNQKGHFVIDLKPQNCFMHRSKLYLTLLDCDGFCITAADGQVYPAHQFSEEYIAPEFIKSSPHELREEQDKFALAVIIFKLLNNGIHPFQAGMARARKTIQEMVAAQNYAYGLRGSGRLIPHNQSIHEYFPRGLREAFDGAFLSKPDRPSASDWRILLRDIVDNKSGEAQRCDERPDEHVDLGLGCGLCAVENARKSPSAKVKPQVSKGLIQKGSFKIAQPRTQVFNKRTIGSRNNLSPLPNFTLNDITQALKAKKFFRWYYTVIVTMLVWILMFLWPEFF